MRAFKKLAIEQEFAEPGFQWVVNRPGFCGGRFV